MFIPFGEHGWNVCGWNVSEENYVSKRRGEINAYKCCFFPPRPLPPILISWATRTAPILCPSLRRSLYWLNESAPKAGSQALWSNPIWFYPIASAGHQGINNKQLYHKCLITQHNLLMAPSCSCSHPVHGKQCNRLAIPPWTWGIFMHCETNRFKFLHKSHKADFSILTNWKKNIHTNPNRQSRGWGVGKAESIDPPAKKGVIWGWLGSSIPEWGRGWCKITSVFSCNMFLLSLHFNMNEIIWASSNLTMLQAYNDLIIFFFTVMETMWFQQQAPYCSSDSPWSMQEAHN